MELKDIIKTLEFLDKLNIDNEYKENISYCEDVYQASVDYYNKVINVIVDNNHKITSTTIKELLFKYQYRQTRKRSNREYYFDKSMELINEYNMDFMSAYPDNDVSVIECEYTSNNQDVYRIDILIKDNQIEVVIEGVVRVVRLYDTLNDVDMNDMFTYMVHCM